MIVHEIRLKQGGTHIVFEHFADETVMINLTNGHYYSLNPAGRIIWELLKYLPTREQIIKAFSTGLNDESDAVEKDVNRFLDLLLHENLIKKTAESSDTALPPPGQPLSCRKPAIEIYTDQQELLLLDPIHEVNESGWPASGKSGPEN